MANENEGSKPGRQQPEGEPRFSQQQYDLLKSCSDKEEMTEWNERRYGNWDEEIRLQEADLMDAHLEDSILDDAHLENANLQCAHLENADLGDAHLEYANLAEAHLENSILWDAHLENADLIGAHLENAKLRKSHLENAYLRFAHLENANLTQAHLENADLIGANLENAYLEFARLEKAKLMEANLRGAYFWNAKLQGADFSRAIVDGETLFSENCEVDRNTKFEAVALGNLRIYPKIKQLLEYNIRRMNWEDWYKGKSENKWIIKIDIVPIVVGGLNGHSSSHSLRHL